MVTLADTVPGPAVDRWKVVLQGEVPRLPDKYKAAQLS